MQNWGHRYCGIDKSNVSINQTGNGNCIGVPPISPTPRPYHRVACIRTLDHVGGGNRCGEDTCRGLLRHTLANEALVYPSKGGRYRAEGCMALG